MERVSDADLILLLKDVDSLSYVEQYTRWNHFLTQLEDNSSENYVLYLGMFLEIFPFTFLHWAKYLSYNNQHLDEAYPKALIKNPKCIQMWRMYIDYLKEGDDSKRYKKELERAIVEIGADLKSVSFFREYYELLSDNNGKYEFFKKLFTRPIEELETFWDQFEGWIGTLNQQELQAIYLRELKDTRTDVNFLELLKLQNLKVYKKSLAHRLKRQEIENQINHFYFCDHIDRPDQIDIWRKYIYLQRSSGVVENITYCYERALMSHTEVILLWEETFHYLENETGKYLSVLTIMRNHSELMVSLSQRLYFYWCDLEERENPEESRKMYKKLEEHTPLLSSCPLRPNTQVYLRHIQLELRHSRVDNAKEIYDQLLLLNQNDVGILSFVVVEYAGFIMAQYKEAQFTRKLYQSYFAALPFNSFLFLSYLDFMRSFENNEGYYDQLMSLLVQGYTKARKSSASEGHQTMLLIKQHLRISLGSINLIKISQKRLHELQTQLSLL